jgi:hypothetical protein
MKANIAAIGMVLCFGGMVGLFLWQSFKLTAETERANAAEARAEKLSIGQDFLAAVVKYVKENCDDKLSVCKQEAVMELPCYPDCSRGIR